MKVGRIIVSIVGLLALALAYVTGNLYFLALAVVAFIAGLYLMGANRAPAKKSEEEQDSREKGSKH